MTIRVPTQQDKGWENAILSDPTVLHLGACYARDTLGHRWKEWEDKVVACVSPSRTLANAIVWYSAEVLEERWHAVEPIILRTSRQVYTEEGLAVVYAEQVIKGEWDELEQVILQGQAKNHRSGPLAEDRLFAREAFLDCDPQAFSTINAFTPSWQACRRRH